MADGDAKGKPNGMAGVAGALVGVLGVAVDAEIHTIHKSIGAKENQFKPVPLLQGLGNGLDSSTGAVLSGASGIDGNAASANGAVIAYCLVEEQNLEVF